MAAFYPKPIQYLIDLFAKFPGIGPRQATRFVFFLLRERETLLPMMKKALSDIEAGVGICTECYRTTEGANVCAICNDQKRDQTVIAVLEKEADMQHVEKTGAFRGRYHLLGGTISALDPESPKRLHLKELHARIVKILTAHESGEVILGTSATTEGDMTAIYIERILTPLKTQYPRFSLSRLGRGLSAGAELEYADEQTLQNALQNRK